MRKLLFLLPGILAAASTQAQTDIETYVKEKTVAVATVQPDSAAFSDLDVIGNAIGDARIVMLGEQDHGDAPAFLAKSRLIRYLHEKKGFNVVAFENDFFASTNGWDGMEKTTEGISSFLKKNILAIWSYCDACSPLLYHIVPESHHTTRPITITGIDNQMFWRYSAQYLVARLDSVLKSRQLPVTSQADYETIILPMLRSLTKLSVGQQKETFFDSAATYLTGIRQEMNMKMDKDDYWILIVDNLISMTVEFKYLKKDPQRGTAERDKQMAKNLAWLCRVKYPNEKIIVWAQNLHISKYAGHYPKNYMNKVATMGTEFTNDPAFDSSTYIIGFTSYAGEAGRLGNLPVPVEKPAANSFETWINESYQYAFVDFRPFNQQHPGKKVEFSMKGSTMGVHANQQSQWTRIFDGVFYIRNTYRCKQVQ